MENNPEQAYASAIVHLLDRKSGKVSPYVCYPITRVELQQMEGDMDMQACDIKTVRVFAVEGAGPGGKWCAPDEKDLQAEIARLDRLINTPETANFLEGVQREAAHQVARWGEVHDRQKSAEHWYWLVGYLAGKALRAAITGDRDKALHHTISSAAALLHWHTAISQDETVCGRGRDADLQAFEDGRASHEGA